MISFWTKPESNIHQFNLSICSCCCFFIAQHSRFSGTVQTVERMYADAVLFYRQRERKSTGKLHNFVTMCKIISFKSGLALICVSFFCFFLYVFSFGFGFVRVPSI